MKTITTSLFRIDKITALTYIAVVICTEASINARHWGCGDNLTSTSVVLSFVVKKFANLLFPIIDEKLAFASVDFVAKPLANILI